MAALRRQRKLEAMPRRCRIVPTTRLGMRAAWLAAGFVVLQLAWRVLPGGALAAFVCGAAAGIVALVAIVRRHERSLVGYVAVAPLALVVLFVAAELLIGHD